MYKYAIVFDTNKGRVAYDITLPDLHTFSFAINKAENFAVQDGFRITGVYGATVKRVNLH